MFLFSKSSATLFLRAGMLFPGCTFPFLWARFSTRVLSEFFALAVVLSKFGVLEDDGCDERSEEDDDDRVEETGELRLHL